MLSPMKDPHLEPLGSMGATRYDESSEEGRIWLKVSQFVRHGLAHCQAHWRRAAENELFISPLTSQWPAAALAELQRQERPTFSTNDLGSGIAMLAGQEITSRPQPSIQPREGSDDLEAQVWDDYLRYERQRGQAVSAESQMFRHLLTRGMGWVQVRTEFRNGTTPTDHYLDVPMWEVVWDPRARLPNLTDREFQLWGRWVPIQAALRILPGGNRAGAEERLKKLRDVVPPLAGEHHSSQGGNQPWTSSPGTGWGYYGGAGSDSGSIYDRRHDSVFVIEAEWRESEDRIELELLEEEFARLGLVLDPVGVREEEMVDPAAQPDPETGEPPVTVRRWLRFDLSTDDWKAWQEAWGEVFDGEPSYVEVPHDRIRYAVLVGDEVWKHGTRRQGTWTFLAATCWSTERPGQYTEWWGVVDASKDAQLMAIKTINLILEVIAFAQKGLIEVDTNKLVDPESIGGFARPGQLIQVNGLGAVKIHTSSSVPSDIWQILDRAQADVLGRLGINKATWASSDLRRISGTTLDQVRQSATIVMAAPFEHLRLYKEHAARLAVCNAKAFWTPEQLRRVLKPSLSEAVPDLGGEYPLGPVTRDLDFDIVLSEAPNTPTSMQQAFNSLVETGLVQTLLSLQALTGADVIKMLPPGAVQADHRSEILRRLEGGDLGLDQRVAQLEQLVQSMTGGGEGGGEAAPPTA